MEFISIPAIVVICYTMAELFKLFFREKTKIYAAIPIFVGIVGGVIGAIVYFVDPSMIGNSPNLLIAISIGIISGLASTGSNQVIKQMIKK